MTIQAQILDLLQRLQRERGMAMLFVTHNLGAVAEIADQVSVMYAGRVVESGPVAAVLTRPRHPYTQGLMAAMPRLGTASVLRATDEPLPGIPGQVPGIAERPRGCSFAPRCGLAEAACRDAVPALVEVAPGHRSRCLRWRELAA